MSQVKRIHEIDYSIRYRETILGELTIDSIFMYFGSITSTFYRVTSKNENYIFYCKTGDEKRNYKIDLNKNYKNTSNRYFRRVLVKIKFK